MLPISLLKLCAQGFKACCLLSLTVCCMLELNATMALRHKCNHAASHDGGHGHSIAEGAAVPVRRMGTCADDAIPDCQPIDIDLCCIQDGQGSSHDECPHQDSNARNHHQLSPTCLHGMHAGLWGQSAVQCGLHRDSSAAASVSHVSALPSMVITGCHGCMNGLTMKAPKLNWQPSDSAIDWQLCMACVLNLASSS